MARLNDRTTFGEAFEAVLGRARAGDAAAFQQLYDRFGRPVRAFAESRRVEDSEAIANDTMLRVFQNLGRFEGNEDQFVSWVFTIARNRIIDEHRRSTRRPVLADRDGTPEPARPHPSAEVQAIGRMAHQRAVAMLDVLTDDQREVVALRMIEDLSLEQVAAIVDKPITAVKALQRRGLARLQREIFDEAVS